MFFRRLSLAILAAALLAVTVAHTRAEVRPPAGAFGPSWVDGKASRGEEITADLPLAEMFWNVGSKVDGAGMCVDTSVEQGARYQGLTPFRGFRDWCAAREPGGSYPSKLADQIRRYSQAKGITEPAYLQYEGPDPGPVLELVDKTGRIACIAYGYSPRYGQAINHMVFSPKPASGQYAVVVDNNAIGGITGNESSRYEWMARDELVTRMKVQADRWGRAVPSNAWVFVWLEAPPPPAPWN